MSLLLDWNSELKDFQIPDHWNDLLNTLLKEAAKLEKLEEGHVSLTFVDDETIQQLNLQFREIDRPTDVLSFAMHDSSPAEMEIWYEDEAPDMLGDIIISIPTAQRQSKEYDHTLEREIGFLFVHGFLHLLGYDHKTEEEEAVMFKRQEEVLESIGLRR